MYVFVNLLTLVHSLFFDCYVLVFAFESLLFICSFRFFYVHCAHASIHPSVYQSICISQGKVYVFENKGYHFSEVFQKVSCLLPLHIVIYD